MASDIATQRSEVAEAAARGQLCRDLLGGTPSMVKAGTRYVPRGQRERDEDYQARLQSAVLLNAYRRTRDYLAGQVFSKDVALPEDAEAAFQAIAQDVDLKGNNLSVWAKGFFLAALDEGAQLLLVEYPRVQTRRNEAGQTEYLDEKTGDWRPKTLLTDAEQGWRPYFVRIPLADLLGWRFESAGSRQRLVQVRIRERVEVNEGDYGVATREQVRVLYPGRWEVWRKADQKRDEWSLAEQGEMSLSEIPLTVFMPGLRLSEMTAAPALEDLAQLNRRHWQASVDQAELMSWVRRPGWFGRGLAGDGQIEFGPGRLTHSTDPTAELKSVGVDAASVGAARQELQDLEERMALYGLQLLMPRTGTVTATERALGSAESDSTLKAWALGLKDALEQALVFAGQWLGGQAKAPTVTVNTDFHILGADVTVLLDAARSGLIPRQVLWDEMVRRGLVLSDMTWPEVQALLEHEARQAPGGGFSGLGTALLGRNSSTSQAG